MIKFLKKLGTEESYHTIKGIDDKLITPYCTNGEKTESISSKTWDQMRVRTLIQRGS